MTVPHPIALQCSNTLFWFGGYFRFGSICVFLFLLLLWNEKFVFVFVFLIVCTIDFRYCTAAIEWANGRSGCIIESTYHPKSESIVISAATTARATAATDATAADNHTAAIGAVAASYVKKQWTYKVSVSEQNTKWNDKFSNNTIATTAAEYNAHVHIDGGKFGHKYCDRPATTNYSY